MFRLTSLPLILSDGLSCHSPSFQTHCFFRFHLFSVLQTNTSSYISVLVIGAPAPTFGGRALCLPLVQVCRQKQTFDATCRYSRAFLEESAFTGPPFLLPHFAAAILSSSLTFCLLPPYEINLSTLPPSFKTTSKLCCL